jgi:sulfide dehydrogenase cytochrome subunit
MKTIAAMMLALSSIPAFANESASAASARAIAPAARLAASCTGCHGTDGATQGNALPPLAGQPKDQLLAALKDFKSAKRPATIMTQLAKGYTDEQLEALASYFASQKK